MEVVALLLAAGAASRFGSDKLLHPLPHGVPIAVQAARHLRAVLARVIAAVRPGAGELAERLAAEGCTVLACERAAEGMGATLACAVRAAPFADGYLVALGDMPYVRPSTILAVCDALAAGATLAAPYYRGERGHPVGFAAGLRPELEALAGDEGARRLLEAHLSELRKVPVGDPGVLRDIDRPADLSPPLAV